MSRLFKIIQKSIRIFAGWAITPIGLLTYIRVRNRKYYDIVMCDHIGDFLYTIGYLRQFKQINHISHLRIIGTTRLQNLVRLYPGIVDEYRTVGKFQLQIMLFPYRTSIGKTCFQCMKNVKVIEPSRDFVQQFDYVSAFPNLTLRDCIKYGILRLPEEVQMELPCVPDNFPVKEKRAQIMLCPSAVVTEWKPYQRLFRRLAKMLSQNRIKVYENKASMPLYEFANLASRMDCVIGMRSGLLDLAALIGCRVIALYPDDSAMMNYFDLRKMNERNHKIVQYRMSGSMTEDIRQILKLAHGFKENADED